MAVGCGTVCVFHVGGCAQADTAESRWDFFLGDMPHAPETGTDSPFKASISQVVCQRIKVASMWCDVLIGCGHAGVDYPTGDVAEGTEHAPQHEHQQRRQPVAQIASIEHMLEAAEVGLSAEVVEQVRVQPPVRTLHCPGDQSAAIWRIVNSKTEVTSMGCIPGARQLPAEGLAGRWRKAGQGQRAGGGTTHAGCCGCCEAEGDGACMAPAAPEASWEADAQEDGNILRLFRWRAQHAIRKVGQTVLAHRR